MTPQQMLDEIERLQNENNELRQLLQPFSAHVVYSALRLYYKQGYFEPDEYVDLDWAMDNVSKAEDALKRQS